MHTPVKNLCTGNFTDLKKQIKMGTFNSGVCDKATAQMAHFRSVGIVSGPIRHRKNVPFGSEFRWGCTVWAL